MTSLLSLDTFKSGAVLAAGIYILDVMGLDDLVAKTVRGITGPLFSIGGIDLPEGLGLTVVAIAADMIRGLILSKI
jgi:hypothetical protein